ncbi:MAG: RcpC/CpaB family pilus assembly protein [Elusimicrobiota bacterium]|nr:MAG: RcpC/CpaB family pilus assembly protein [Elusimicrobiota bacterium]
MKTALLLAAALAACGRAPSPGTLAAYEPPEGKRAFALVVDKSQSQFLTAGDSVEVVMIVETNRADATTETRSETLAARAEVLRVKNDWSSGTGLVALALSPEEAQLAALAVEREDKLFLNKAPAGSWRPAPKAEPAAPPALEREMRGLAVLAYPDQQEFLAPGDRVDVISARHGYKAGGKSELTALTILQDVLVLRAGPRKATRSGRRSSSWCPRSRRRSSRAPPPRTSTSPCPCGLPATARRAPSSLRR